MIQVINKYGAVKAPAPASSSAIWGAITGTVTAQTDLTGYISSNYYPLLTNPAGYITSSSLTGYVPYTGATANLDLGTFTLTTPTINGVSGLLSFGSTDRVNIGNYATPSAQRIFTVGQNTAYVSIGSVTDSTGESAIYMNAATPTGNNYTLRNDGANTFFNTNVAFGNFYFTCGYSTTPLRITGAQATGAITNFNFIKPNNTTQTASTSIAGFSYVGGTRQWATGAIATQSENVWGAVTYNFGGASIVTNAYGNVFNAPIAGTNATITNNWAGLFNGNLQVAGNLEPSASFSYGLGHWSKVWNTCHVNNLSIYNLAAIDATNGLQFRTTTNSTQMKMFNSGNFKLQNAGTFVDDGFRLDVQGTANVLTSLNVGNYATPSAQRALTIGQDTAWVTIGSFVGATSNSAMYMNAVIPSAFNHVLRSDGSNLWINSPSASSSIIFTTGATDSPLRMYGNQNNSSVANYVLIKPTYVNGTASTAIAGWSYNGTTRQWLTGNITTQSENVWGATTYSFVAASTITNAYGNVFNAPIAGTNCTIAANWAAQFNGGVEVIGLKGLKITTPTSGVGNGAIIQGVSGAYTFTIDGANGSGPRIGLGSTPSSGYDFFEIGAFSSANNFATKDRNFRILSTIATVQDARFVLFASTGNVTLQNGGTFTDAGYRLDVNGTGRFQNTLTLATGTTAIAPLNIPTGVAPTTPNNGDIWYDGTDLKLKSNGSTKDLTTATTLDNLVFSGSYMPAKLGYVAASHTAGINGVLISKKMSGRKTCTITSLSVWCLTGVAGGNVRLAVYSDLNGLPNTLLADTGNIACISSGLKEGTITPLTLVSGTTYHICLQVSSGTISLKYNISEETNYYDPTNFVYVFTVSATFAFAAFPTTFPAASYTSGAGFNEIIYLKAQ